MSAQFRGGACAGSAPSKYAPVSDEFCMDVCHKNAVFIPDYIIQYFGVSCVFFSALLLALLHIV